MFLRSLFTIFALFAFHGEMLHAEDMSPALLSSTEGDPGIISNNAVNIVTGDYQEREIDLVIPGPDPLIVERNYNSSDYITGTSIGGWRMFSQCVLLVGTDKEVDGYSIGGECFEHVYALTGESGGSFLVYNGYRSIVHGESSDFSLRIDLPRDGKGIANSSKKEISGKTNRLNHLIEHLSLDEEYDYRLTTGGGSRRFYKRFESLDLNTWKDGIFGVEEFLSFSKKIKEPQFFLLHCEILPNGNKVFYEYDAQGKLTLVKMTNADESNVFSCLKIHHQMQKKPFRILLESSDGRKVQYGFEEDLSLVSVKRDGMSDLAYTYEKGRLIRKDWPEGKFLQIEYYEESSPTKGQVKSISMPSSTARSAKKIASFVYRPFFDGMNQCSGGETEVFDLRNNKKVYCYNRDFRPTETRQYIKEPHSQYTLYHTEKKIWGKRANAAALQGKSFSDGEGNILSFVTYDYDERGNVVEERLYGNLTGNGEKAIVLDARIGLPEKGQYADVRIKKSSYSSDGFNLLLQQGDQRGSKVLYGYKPGTNLLMKKFVYNEIRQLVHRHYCEYNDDAVLTKTIVDDGHYKEDCERDNFYRVTERRTTSIFPRKKAPCVGLPEIIEEKIFNKEKQTETLLEKKSYVFDSYGRVICQDVYDRDDIWRYSLKKDYDEQGNVILEEDSEGNQTFAQYDANRNLIFERSHHLSIDYKYDACQQLVNVRKTYDDGLVFEEAFSYNEFGDKVSSTDLFGNRSDYVFDVLGRLRKVFYPEVLDENQVLIRPEFSYLYDVFGNVVSETDPKGYQTVKSYNLDGNPSMVSHPDGTQEMLKYEMEGHLHRHLCRDRTVWIYEYDHLGRLKNTEHFTRGKDGSTRWPGKFLSEERKGYDAFHCQWSKDKDGNPTYYKYDKEGRLSSKIQTFGDSTYDFCEKDTKSIRSDYGYDSLGRANRYIQWFGGGKDGYTVEVLDRDIFGRVVEKRIEDANGQVFFKNQFQYSQEGLLEKDISYIQENQTAVSKVEYNHRRQVEKVIDALGNETLIDYDYFYINDLGQKVLKKTVIDALGNQDIFIFDVLGRLALQERKNKQGQMISNTQFYYDALGNKAVEVNKAISCGLEEGEQRKEWIFGPCGRLEELKEAVGTSQERSITFSYNDKGLVEKKMISGALGPIFYEYDDCGRVLETTCQLPHRQDLGEKERYESKRFSYDKRGNIKEATTYLKTKGKYGSSSCKRVHIERKVNCLGRLTEEIFSHYDSQVNLKCQYKILYEYDRQGRVSQIKLPDESKIQYAYLGPFSHSCSRVSPSGKNLYNHYFHEYDLQGKLLREQMISHAGERVHAWDANGNKMQLYTDFFHELVPEGGYDAANNLLSIKKKQGFEETQEHYFYSDAYQLLSEKGSFHHEFLYDSLNNCIQKDEKAASVDALNQLLSFGDETYTYDERGALLNRSVEGEEISFTSNPLNQLMAVESSQGWQLSFTYDAFGRRIQSEKRDYNGRELSSCIYLYIDHHEIGSMESSGKMLDLQIPGYIQGSQVGQSIAIEIDREILAPIYDIRGNVAALIDPEYREVVESYRYSAFGEEKIFDESSFLIEESAFHNPWRFAGKRVDSTTGLVFFGFRDYCPSMGRWINPDPAGFMDGPNLYAYVRNHPFKYRDSLGLSSQDSYSQASSFEEYFYKERSCPSNGAGGIWKGLIDNNLEMGTFGLLGNLLMSSDSVTGKFYGFEEIFKNRSQLFYTGALGSQGLGIGWINGINTDFSYSSGSAEILSAMAGGETVLGVYNATHNWKFDLVECGLGLKGVLTEPAALLQQQWNTFFSQNPSDRLFLQVCHSQGAIHVRNALMDYPEELRNRIKVVAVAPGSYIPRELCHSSIHYVLPGDIVPKFDIKGRQKCKKNTVVLKPDPNVQEDVHSFRNPVYRRPLQDEIKEHIKTEKVKQQIALQGGL